MTSTLVENQTVTIGDTVGFKSDIEQYGTITKIGKTSFGKVELTLERESGFEGEYIGGDTKTTVFADDCWID